MPDFATPSREFRIFQNGLRILDSLDRHELVDAGVLKPDDSFGWLFARRCPKDFFLAICELDDDLAAALWQLIERRQPVSLRSSGASA